MMLSTSSGHPRVKTRVFWALGSSFSIFVFYKCFSKFFFTRGCISSLLSENAFFMEFRATLGNPDFQRAISQALGKNSKIC